MMFTPEAPSWSALGPRWPHRDASRFVEAGSMRWHVQRMGSGPGLLLVHGAGASTHSWRDMMPALAEHFDVLAIDLPGHAFSSTPAYYRPTLPRVAALLAELLKVLEFDTRLATGHSAGAAILAHMALEKQIDPAGIISFNGAFQPFEGAAGSVFPVIAKLLFVNPFAPRLFAIGGRRRARVMNLIEGTGSHISQEGLDYYQDLMRSPGHISGVLGMMASWELSGLMKALPQLDTKLLLIAATEDRAVPAKVSKDVAEACPAAQYEEWPTLGHLAHEEAPEKAVASILHLAEHVGVLAEGISGEPVKGETP